jgi:hypothetical protein
MIEDEENTGTIVAETKKIKFVSAAHTGRQRESDLGAQMRRRSSITFHQSRSDLRAPMRRRNDWSESVVLEWRDCVPRTTKKSNN